MTRINIGIEPKELCDQHLIAEYRELPRVWKFVGHSKIVSKHFSLGQGHILWCAQWPGMLSKRYILLVQEMQYRGFQTRYPHPPTEMLNGAHPPISEIQRARKICLERIRERMRAMTRRPIWTRRKKFI